MIVQIKRILLLLWIFCLPVQIVFSQHTSNNNYTGEWETPTSWSPTWPVPQTNISGYNITINGYMTVNGSLSFLGTCVLTINDTLVIKGNLSLGDNCDLTINNNGILIIWGNLTMHNHSELTANGYLIITGNIDKHGPNNEGSLTSNDNPVKVFVGGTISPANLVNNEPKYPALDCTSPPTTPYPHSGCSYGDMTDIITDPIYPFFQSTCTTATITSSDADNSFCTGTSITFTAGGGTNYNFRVNGTSVQNGGSTTYTTTTLTNGKIVDVIVTSTGGCTVTSSGITNTVFALPAPTFTVQPGATACSATNVTYTTQAGQTSYIWTFTGVSGTDYSITSGGTGTDNTVTLKWLTAGSKTVTINYTNAGGCTAVTATSSTAILVTLLPTPTISGPTPVCIGAAGNVYTTEAGMSNYTWSVSAGGTITAGGGTANNTVTVTWTTTGAQSVTTNYTNINGCTATSPIKYDVTINPLPVTTTSNNGPVCVGSTLSLTGGPATMITYSWTGPNGFTSSLQNPSVSDNATLAMAGVYALTVTISGGCTSAATTTVIVNENPIAIEGPDQELTFVFETQMAAELSSPETGEWSLISGSGHINDIHSPTALVTDLSIGENIFLWKVRIANCEDSAKVKITVNDLFVPSVITPDGDGKNDYFKIGEIIGKVELIIINRWGNEEFTNANYLNDWNGLNNEGQELPNDTYFYIMKFENGIIKKGSVLIKR